MILARSIVLTLTTSLVVAALGVWLSAQYVSHHLQRQTPLHELVHEKLNLTADQQARIADTERDYAARRQVLESEMRAANAELARTIQQHHAYVPQVQAAIDRFHVAMGELQKETVVHTFAMRSVLTADQAAMFDAMVFQSLTEDAQ